VIGWVRAYGASDDPYVAAANFVALVLASNQPFYPVYLWFVLGADAWIGVPDMLSGLAFLAVPALTRRWPLPGRAALVLFGIGNTVVCMKLLGQDSGVGLFLAPCAMLAAILFRWRERFAMVALAGLPPIVWLSARSALGEPPLSFAPDRYASLFSMNAVSVGCLMVFLGWVLAGIHKEAA
jgi:hypothetical protein